MRRTKQDISAQRHEARRGDEIDDTIISLLRELRAFVVKYSIAKYQRNHGLCWSIGMPSRRRIDVPRLAVMARLDVQTMPRTSIAAPSDIRLVLSRRVPSTTAALVVRGVRVLWIRPFNTVEGERVNDHRFHRVL